MDQWKIVFTGPAGAGKTTAIQVLSDIPVLAAEARAQDAAASLSPDYGILKAGDTEQIHLYAAPAQESAQPPAEPGWDALTEGGIGLVLLLDNTRPDPFADLQSYLKAYQPFIDQTKVVIGITRMDVQPAPSIEDYYKQLWSLRRNAPIFEVDARRREDVALLVQALLYSLDPGLSG